MYFFKNGSGWCIRHDPTAAREPITRKSHAPIFRAQAKILKFQASSGKLSKLIKKINEENQPPGGWEN